MKTLKINKVILVLTGVMVFNACVDDNDFKIPNTSIIEPNIPENAKVQINTVASELAQEQGNGALDYTDEDTTNSYAFNENELYMEGYIVSSDEGSNFFKELIIQDKAENPTIGIKLLIDVNPLFIRYETGRKIYVKLNDLSVGITNGVLTLGVLNGSQIDKIPSPLESEFILRSSEIATLVPLPIAFADFSDDKTNLYIQLQDVQFNANEATGDTPLSFAAEILDEFDGERTLESCQSTSSAIFSTSTFADFKSITLPSGRGSMNAILTKDFFGDVFNIVINSPEDINFDNTDRCDPVFEESFINVTDNTILDFTGWINYAETGSVSWMENVYNGNGYARFSAFSSGDSLNIGWLITPAINLDTQNGEILTFETQHAYPDPNHDPLSVLISTDFDGTEASIVTSTWTELSFDVSYQIDYENWFNFMPSGNINISQYTGTAYIAFKYVGSDTANQNMTLDVDNIKIAIP